MTHNCAWCERGCDCGAADESECETCSDCYDNDIAGTGIDEVMEDLYERATL